MPGKHGRTESCRPLDHILEDSIGVDVDEPSIGGVVVDLVDEGPELVVEYLAGDVDPLDAGGPVGAALGQLVGAAPNLPHSDQRHFPRSVVVQCLQLQHQDIHEYLRIETAMIMARKRRRKIIRRLTRWRTYTSTHPKSLGVLLNELVSVLFWCKLAARRVILRHEVVVEVIVASQSDCVDAFAQVIRGCVLIPQNVHHLRHGVLVILDLPRKTYPSSLLHQVRKQMQEDNAVCELIIRRMTAWKGLHGKNSWK